MEGAKDAGLRVLIGPGDGSERMIMRLITIQPGGHTPRHKHDGGHVISVYKGKGIAVDEKGKEHEVLPGQSLCVPPWETHQFKNPFSEPFEFLCIIPNPDRSASGIH
jgi:quercetin dioxygenase-like cupin family protein